MSVKMRQEVERKVIKALVDESLKAGYLISVYDGEEMVVKKSDQADAIMNAIMSTDEDTLLYYKPGQNTRSGWVKLIYGNDGYDVISDYTISLEHVMGEATKVSDYYAD